ncbi:MAG TPA: WD40 repeat domain-containing protein, partial [Gemmataceae bacterium]|nr:WD40 repeat domain-containing protein [Gemmataceae bacterium]
SLWKVAATNTLDRWPLWTWSNDNRPVLSLALSPDGRTVACVVGRQEITEGKKGQMIQQAGGRPQDVGEVILLDAATGKEKGRLVGHTAEVYSVAFSPDGRRLATAGAAWEDASQRRHGEIKLWHAKTYKEEASLRGHGAPVLSIAFSPDGALLASGGFDYTVKLWSLADGKEIHTLPGHVCLVHSVAFSPDGKRLASGSEDWTVKVWDVQLGAETLDLRGHWDRVQAVAFSPEGDRLFSGSEDGSLRVWEAPRQR